MKISHSDIMNQLKKTQNAILSEEETKNKILYLDIPIHGNIGDLLILQGTLKYLENKNINKLEIYSALDFNFQKIESGDIILLHGGGNFGDLYELHQNFREKVVSNYPNNKIIQLPQSLHYEKKINLESSKKIFKQHKNFHLYVRDEESLELGKKITNNIYLMPDMAHQLYPIKSEKFSNPSSLALYRKDKEQGTNQKLKKVNNELDWCDLIGKNKYIIELYSKTLRIKKPKILNQIIIKSWIKYSYKLTNLAINLYNQNSKIITNRLHGHILASLMSIENIVYDNSYGKNKRYINLWTKNSELTSFKSN